MKCHEETPFLLNGGHLIEPISLLHQLKGETEMFSDPVPSDFRI